MLKMENTLMDYKPPIWAATLRNIPKKKLLLANADTPIHPWNLEGVPSGFSLSIKRDDMTGTTLTGNKARKLEFLMADAVSRNYKHVITCGALHSNHCRAVAVSSRQLGLTPHLLLLTDETDIEPLGFEGNILLNRMCASKMYLASLTNTVKEGLQETMEQVVQDIQNTTGEPCYQIPSGGSNEVGVWGYMDAFDELIQQGSQDRFDDIVFACGSGGTAAGLAIANYLSGSKLRVHGVSITELSGDFYQHVNTTMQSLGVDARAEDILNIIDGYVGEGYDIASQEDLDFIINTSSTTGIMLDPTYTCKAVRGMLHELQHNPDRFKGRRILFLHTVDYLAYTMREYMRH